MHYARHVLFAQRNRSKLGTTEDQVKLLVRDGKLREFRDGSNLLFKIEEVEGLLGENIDLSLDAVDLDNVDLTEDRRPRSPARRGRAPMSTRTCSNSTGKSRPPSSRWATSSPPPSWAWPPKRPPSTKPPPATTTCSSSPTTQSAAEPAAADGYRGRLADEPRRREPTADSGRRRNFPRRRVRHPGRGQQHHRHGHRRYRREASTSWANPAPISTSPRTRWPRPPSGPPAQRRSLPGRDRRRREPRLLRQRLGPAGPVAAGRRHLARRHPR